MLTAKQSAKESGDGADAVLFADEKLLAGLRRGDSLRFLDTRGRRRRLDVVAVTRAGVVTEMLRTAYITNGTTLSRPGPGRHSRMKADVHGIAPAAGIDFLVVRRHVGRCQRARSRDSPPARFVRPRAESRARSCTLASALARSKIGERISFDDGLISGRVQAWTAVRYR